MHLKQLKLAGFKSFVDPTVIPFSSQLIAVVGPNGCGKSNIIDAVRWVMGESSAKHLRGESMADVIFNGSTQRKSLGQASVELVFDNSMGRLTGPYASYQEIVVKRLVTRDGDSFYFLNGSRCRRRDITDIFLGTGAGARSYSIIGQDTISRLIEARPEELRAYLEEAAGVSKYKERRRETLQRIHQTRDNLSRLADIRDELAKQLVRLERQAQAAERYTQFKHEERLCKAEILALKWRAITTEQQPLRQALNDLLLKQEQHRAHIAALIKKHADLQAQLHTKQGHVDEAQHRFYEIKTEIVRLEETIQQQQREKQRIEADKAHIHMDLQTAQLALEQDRAALNVSEQAIELMQHRLAALQAEHQERQVALEHTEQQKKEWDTHWQQAQISCNQAQRDTQVLDLRLQHIEERLQQTHIRLEKIDTELGLIALEPLREVLIQLEEEQRRLVKQQHQDEENHQQQIAEISRLKQELIGIDQQLRHVQDKVQSLATEQAVLKAAQDAVLRQAKQQGPALAQWDNHPRLAEVIQVPEQWIRACEMVLGDGLQAILVESMDPLWTSLTQLNIDSVLFVAPSPSFAHPTPWPRLSEKLGGVIPRWQSALHQIFAADDLPQALSWLPSIADDQSIVTPDGYWLGPGWLRVAKVALEDDTGVLYRQQALVTIKDNLAVEHTHLHALHAERDQLHLTLVHHEQEHQMLQDALMGRRDELRACEGALANKQHVLEQSLIRSQALTEEHAELLSLIEELVSQKIEVENERIGAMQALQQQQLMLEELAISKIAMEDALTTARHVSETSLKTLHQEELGYQRELSMMAQLRDRLNREQTQIETLQGRLNVLIQQSQDQMNPDEALSAVLDQQLKLHEQWDAQLIAHREALESIQQAFSDCEHLTKQEDALAQASQEQYQQAQLQEQALAVRADGLLEALTELNADAQTLLSVIPGDTTVQSREQTLLSLDEKIKRLGAINLVAIEEYQIESERKQHLDEQYQDLMEALATLDGAIAKMDKETQLRLKDTFDQVNIGFQTLFPRLFGGGRAKLELTCDNLLEAGILVMAQPPGKRNSTIHLLSGGEKAMTAVALVFAIFQLNPSPFCMLDEVDAPLDDLNVKRFCEMVKEMSPLVQFLFITHNKVTMELADHLIGVTMREPGVSRVVAVDVEMALE